MFSGTVFTQSGDPGPDVALPRSCWDVFHHVDGTTPIGAIADRLGFSDAELFAAVRQLETQGLIEEAVMTYGEYETYAAPADPSDTSSTASPADAASEAPVTETLDEDAVGEERTGSEGAGDALSSESPSSESPSSDAPSVPEEKTAAYTGDEAPPVDSDVTNLKGTSDDEQESVERAASDVAETVASDRDEPASTSEPSDDAGDGASSTLFMDEVGASRGDGTAEQPSEPTSSEPTSSDPVSSESTSSEPASSDTSTSDGLTTAELNVEDITEEVLDQRTLHVPSFLSWLRETMSNEKDFRNVKAFVLMEASDVLGRHDITDVDDLEAVDHFDDPDAILALEKAVRNNVHERIPETCYQ